MNEEDDSKLICEICGKEDDTVNCCIDPFLQEIYEEIQYVILCDECYKERCYEI